MLIVWKKRNYQFKRIQDLGDYRLLSWQGAIAHLGNEYAQMAINNPLYSEHHDQSIQVKMLFLERVDVIKMDEQIFNYFRAKVGSHQIIDTSFQVDRFGFFGENPNSFIFRTEKLKNESRIWFGSMYMDEKYMRNRFLILSSLQNIDLDEFLMVLWWLFEVVLTLFEEYFPGH